jgi:replicative DNA helicase
VSLLSSQTVEQQIFHFCLEHPEKITEIKDNYFLSSEGRDLYETLLELYRENVSFTDENIISTGNRVNEGITPVLLSAIRSVPYDSKAWDHYRFLVQEAYAKDRIQTTLLKDGLTSVTVKGRLDVDKLQNTVYEIQECINLAKGRASSVKTIGEMFDSYQNVLSQRVDGTAFYDTGCSLLNAALPTGFAPGEITTIFGSTGIGKSTYSLYLINRLINKFIPCFYISLEMSETATMDRWMASRLRIPLRELFSKKGQIDESIYERVCLEREKLEHGRKFAFIDETRISSTSLEKMINQVKLKLQTDYLVVFVDLATMLEDFADGTPIAYEQAMNSLHQVTKRTGVHLVIIVQAVNKTLENHRPATIEGLRLFRPLLSSIKNSGAIAERSRQVLSVFRQHYYAQKFFPEDILVAEEDDIMDVQVLKCSNGAVGSMVHYLYDGGLFRVYPIPGDYIPRTAAGLRREQLGENNDGEI